jgi:hypothetical protein
VETHVDLLHSPINVTTASGTAGWTTNLANGAVVSKTFGSLSQGRYFAEFTLKTNYPAGQDSGRSLSASDAGSGLLNGGWLAASQTDCPVITFADT